MIKDMAASSPQFKIIWTVIQLVLILVVWDFVTHEKSSQFLLHHQTVFQNVSGLCGEWVRRAVDIPIPVTYNCSALPGVAEGPFTAPVVDSSWHVVDYMA